MGGGPSWEQSELLPARDAVTKQPPPLPVPAPDAASLADLRVPTTALVPSALAAPPRVGLPPAAPPAALAPPLAPPLASAVSVGGVLFALCTNESDLTSAAGDPREEQTRKEPQKKGSIAHLRLLSPRC